MVLLDNGKFLTELHKLYDANKERTVWVTMKHSEYRPAPGWECCWWPVEACSPLPRARQPHRSPPTSDQSPQVT